MIVNVRIANRFKGRERKVLQTSGVDLPNFFAKQEVAGAQCLAKNCFSISPLIKTPNFKFKLAHRLPN